MKRFLTILTVIVVSAWSSINAQESSTSKDSDRAIPSPFKAAITMGASFSHPKEFESFVGYKVGVKGEYTFPRNENFYLSASLSAANKGWNLLIYTLDEATHVWDWDLHYLELPVLVGYKYRLSSTANLFLELGPYAAFGFWGYNDFKIDGEDLGTKNVFPDDCRRFDYGIQINTGLNINQWQCGVGYSHGFVSPSKIKMIRPQRDFLHLDVAYFF